MEEDLTALSTKKNGLASLRILAHSYIELNRYSFYLPFLSCNQERRRPLAEPPGALELQQSEGVYSDFGAA